MLLLALRNCMLHQSANQAGSRAFLIFGAEVNAVLREKKRAPAAAEEPA